MEKLYFENDNDAIIALRNKYEILKNEVGVIVGQDEVGKM